MPWTCSSCKAESPNEVSACRECGHTKTAWTLAINETRQMVIPRKGFVCLRTESREPVETVEAYAKEQWEKTDYVHAVPKPIVRKLLEQNKLPCPADLLTVRMSPANAKDLNMDLTVLFDRQAAKDLSFPGPEPGPATVEARFLLVYDDDEESEPIEIQGLEVVDVTELKGEDGYAPHIEVVCLKRREQELDVIDSRFELRLINPLEMPIPETPFVAKLPDGTEIEGKTNKKGVARLDAPEEGQIEITYQDPDDLVAKAEAGHALHALKTKNRDGLARAFNHNPEMGPLIRDAYDTYFNELSGQGLIEDIYATFTDPTDIGHLEIVLVHCGLETRGTVKAEMQEKSFEAENYADLDNEEEDDIYEPTPEEEEEKEPEDDGLDDENDDIYEALDQEEGV